MKIEHRKQYICEYCGESFKSEHECWAHEKIVHEGKKPVNVVSLYYNSEDDCFEHQVEDGFVPISMAVADFGVCCDMFGNIKWSTFCEPAVEAEKAALEQLSVLCAPTEDAYKKAVEQLYIKAWERISDMSTALYKFKEEKEKQL